MKRMFFLLLMLLLVYCAFAIEVSGHYTHNATWSPENNPYIVTAFLYVDYGATLTILPGVEVQVYSADKNNINNFYWNGANQPQAKMIIVNGRIIAEGTEQNPIKFNKYGDNADLRWGGIRISSQAQIGSFEHCEFRNTFFCNYSSDNLSYGAVHFENSSINIRSCLFELNYTAIDSGSMHSDILLYDCKFISYSDNYPTPYGNTVFIAIGANHNQIPSDYYKLTIAKCYFTGNASLMVPGYYVSIILLNNLFADFNNFRNEPNIRLEDYGNTCDYGNQVIGGKIGLGCYSASAADTVYSRRNRIITSGVNGSPSTISCAGTGINLVSDNYLEGCVQFNVTFSDRMNTYFYNNYLETSSSCAIDLNDSGTIHTGQMRIFNNVFRNIDPNIENHHSMIRASYLSPLVYNNTFVDYYAIMEGVFNATHFTNNIFRNFTAFIADAVSATTPPRLVNNCFNIPIPAAGSYIDGGGNIVADPLFADEENGNFQLQAGSPCIDAGIPLADLPQYDVRYFKRTVMGTVHNTVDMGAYEYNSVYIGGIQGFVYDEQTGLPIDCVKIAIHNKLPEFSDTLGCFPFNTGAGTYIVTASRWDYEDVVIPNVVVTEGNVTTLNIPMHLTSTGNDEEVLPPEVGGTQLSNYPNPFNPSTTISFGIPEASHVNLSIYNIKGQKVMQLVDENMPLGQHKVAWNGKNGEGNACASGVYFYRLNTADKCVTKKMILMK